MDTFDRDLLKNYQHFQIPIDKGSTVEYMHQDNLNEIGFNVCRRNIHVAKGQKVLIGEDKKHEIDTNEISRGFISYLVHFLNPSLSSSHRKKKIHPKNISYISVNGTLDFLSQVRKIKKSTPRKFLIFQGTETLKRFLIFSQKKAVLIFRK